MEIPSPKCFTSVQLCSEAREQAVRQATLVFAPDQEMEQAQQVEGAGATTVLMLEAGGGISHPTPEA